MIESAPSSSSFCLLQLPQDVQLSILLVLDIRELIICKRICRSLAQLIDDDISVQYKIELARAGRVNRAHSLAIAVADRLTSLRKHRARLRAGDHPLKRLQGQPFGSRDALSANGFVTTVSNDFVHLWRPAAALTGIRELAVAHSVQELGLTGIVKSSCVGDAAQDLLVFSGKNLNTLSYDCWIYSLAKGGPHPTACQSRISAGIDTDDWPGVRAWDSVQILGDLIAWNVPDHDTKRCEMKVINWKTGVTIWEFRSELLLLRCRLISQSYVVVVMSAALLVYPINCHRTSPATPSTIGTALCVLRLPAWPSTPSSREQYFGSFIQFPPPLGPNDRPFHRYDPSLTLLTLNVHYSFDTAEHKCEKAQCAIFIPVATITAHVERSLRSPPPAQAPHIRVVPWNDWGPAGTYIAHFDVRDICQFSPMGPSCVVTQRRRDVSGYAFLRVFVFDVQTWARPSDAERLEERRRVMHDMLPSEPAFARTSFPFDVTRRDIPLARDERTPTVVLTDDGLLLVT